MNRGDVSDLLEFLGAKVCGDITKDTQYLIVGESPDTGKLSAALSRGVRIVTEGYFARLLSGSEL